MSVDHIPADPPGGRWIAPGKQTTDFVRRFEKTGETILVGVSLARLVGLAYDVNQHDVVVADADRAMTFDVIVKPPPGKADTSYAMLRELIRDELGLVLKPRRVEGACMILEPQPGGLPLAPSDSREGRLDLERGQLVARGVTMAHFIEFLRRDVKRAIVDETGLPEHYDFVLEWDPGKGAYAFLQALGDIGLRLEAGVREIDRWVVVNVPIRRPVGGGE